MAARGARPRSTKQEVRKRLANLFTAAMNLVDSQSKTEQERLGSVRAFGWMGLDALGRVDQMPLKEIRARQRLSDALLEPLMRDSREKWLRRQLEGLGKERTS